MNIQKIIGWGIITLALHGCASVQKNQPEPLQSFASAQALITQKQLNNRDGSAKDYIYDGGQQQGELEPESLYPRKYLSQYCHATGGKFSLLYKSNLSLVKDPAAKRALAAHRHVKQGIGAYQCQTNQAQNWIVSIEPVAEHQLMQGHDGSRVVSLQTRLMSLEESKNFYGKITNSTVTSKKIVTQSIAVKNNKHGSEKETESKKESDLKKELDIKKEHKLNTEIATKLTEKRAETPQSQQLRYYVDARKDLSKNQNQIAACNNAEKAYSFGKLYNTNGSNVYAESGVLVAKCLTHVSAYKNRFANPKARAVGILQNLATNQNHAGAKYMLKQIQ
ncbi:hypothetical protein [Acinetobacter ihumii]|uniref:hypothetical protein n=1 Tax=Acinetobacter ihumii TaxID=2483802 RepID=UPI001D186FE5|nr:hypothetical protein [Acinetobacter ihumii]